MLILTWENIQLYKHKDFRKQSYNLNGIMCNGDWVTYNCDIHGGIQIIIRTEIMDKNPWTIMY